MCPLPTSCWLLPWPAPCLRSFTVRFAPAVLGLFILIILRCSRTWFCTSTKDWCYWIRYPASIVVIYSRLSASSSFLDLNLVTTSSWIVYKLVCMPVKFLPLLAFKLDFIETNCLLTEALSLPVFPTRLSLETSCVFTLALAIAFLSLAWVWVSVSREKSSFEMLYVCSIEFEISSWPKWSFWYWFDLFLVLRVDPIMWFWLEN